MKLLIPERLSLMELIPRKDDYPMLCEYRKIRELLPFTDEEIKEYAIKIDDKGVTWDYGKAVIYLKDIPCTEAITNKIKTILLDLEHSHELKDAQLTLFEKFVTFFLG